MCYRRKTVCRAPVTRPSVWERGLPTRGLTGRPRDLVAEALDTMGFFECPRLRRGLAREYWFLPWSLRQVVALSFSSARNCGRATIQLCDLSLQQRNKSTYLSLQNRAVRPLL